MDRLADRSSVTCFRGSGESRERTLAVTRCRNARVFGFYTQRRQFTNPKALQKVSYGMYTLTSGKDGKLKGQIVNAVLRGAAVFFGALPLRPSR